MDLACLKWKEVQLDFFYTSSGFQLFRKTLYLLSLALNGDGF